MATKYLPKGSWSTEPDSHLSKDEEGRLFKYIKRDSLGYLTGYVGVHSWHPLYHRDAHELRDLRVHNYITRVGEITFYKSRLANGQISHSELEDVWWMGFSCDGPYDLVPSEYALHQFMKNLRRNHPDLDLPPLPSLKGKEYRTIDFVHAELSGLADQIKTYLTIH